MARDGDPLDESGLPAVDDSVFEALSSRTRRIVLYVLRTRGRVGVAELADVVTGWQHADGVGMAARADRDRTDTALRERHLPALVDADLVAHDEAAGTVAPRPHSPTVRSLIDFAAEHERGSDASS